MKPLILAIVTILMVMSCSEPEQEKITYQRLATIKEVQNLSINRIGDKVNINFTIPVGSFKSVLINRVNPIGHPQVFPESFVVGQINTSYGNGFSTINNQDTTFYCAYKLITANQLITNYVDTLNYNGTYKYQVSLSPNLSGIGRYSFTEIIEITY